MKKIIFSCAIILVLLCNGCIKNKDAETSLWENAKKVNRVESYKEYITKFPNGKFINQADSIIQVFVWEETKKLNNPESYEKYLSNYPKGYYVNEAKMTFEKVLWDNANKTSNMEYYIKYKTLFPNGNKISDVNKFIDRFLIESGHVGYFKIGIPLAFKSYKGLKIVSENETFFNQFSQENYTVTRNYVKEEDKKVLELVINNDTITCINILSDKYKTKKNISLSSPISLFAIKYPKCILASEMRDTYTSEGEFNYLVAKEENGVEFDLQGYSFEITNQDGGGIKIGNSKNNKFEMIMVYKTDIDEYEKSLKEVTESRKREKKEQEDVQRAKVEQAKNSSNKLQHLPYFLSGTKWHAVRGGDIRIKFLDDKYIEMYMPVVGNNRCAFIIKKGYPTGTISFYIGNQSIELIYNTNLETLYKVNGLNNYLNFIKD